MICTAPRPHSEVALLPDLPSRKSKHPRTQWEAALGANITVPTLGGKVDMKIPKGSQAGDRLRLKGRGLPGKPPGDQYVVLQIVTPPAATKAAEAAYQKMAQELPFNPRPDMGE